MTFSADRRRSLVIEYEQLSRERNGINPKLSTYAKLSARMDEITKQLKEYEDPEIYAQTLRKKRNKRKRASVLRRLSKKRI
jgi:hypothetical protein